MPKYLVEGTITLKYRIHVRDTTSGRAVMLVKNMKTIDVEEQATSLNATHTVNPTVEVIGD